MLSYEEAVLVLRGMSHRGWRFGLDRMCELCRRLGVPEGGSPKYIHVAGTNGKGSTTKFIQSILTTNGARTGSCFSPFVFNLRERVQLDGEMIPREDFARLMTDIVRVSDELADTEFESPTEFEAKIALGFLYWNEMNCEYVALETGLGGRLDATNVVNSVVSVITSIGLDHTEILGETLALIAAEKAGIIKLNRPCVMSDLPPEAREVVRKKCVELGSPLHEFGQDWLLAEQDPIPDRMRGEIQRLNAKAATVACHLACPTLKEQAVEDGIRTAYLPGRCQIIQDGARTWVFDGAHNKEATTHLVSALKERFPGRKFSVLIGMLDGHDPAPVIESLAEVASQIVTVPINWTRTANPDDLARIAKEFCTDVTSCWNVEDGLSELRHEFAMVTGSFYLLGKVAKVTSLVEN